MALLERLSPTTETDRSRPLNPENNNLRRDQLPHNPLPASRQASAVALGHCCCVPDGRNGLRLRPGPIGLQAAEAVRRMPIGE